MLADHPAVRRFRDVPPGRAGIFTDFDGTLAAIVDDPSAAVAAEGASDALAALARRYRIVAVVTGRPVLYVARRLHARGVHLVGLHGLESARDGGVVAAPAAEAMRGAVEQAADALERGVARLTGVAVERKGLTVAVHFRRAPDVEAARREAAAAVEEEAARHGLAVVAGRMVLELRPPGGGDKGDAVRALVDAHALDAAMFAGDDAGDVAAFAAVARTRTPLRVAVRSAETPPALLEDADVAVDDPASVVELLQGLA